MALDGKTENTLTFLGTAGARLMVANQVLASGGMWLNFAGTQILIDPGPGSIVQATSRKLKAEELSAIVLSHRHLDHSGDVNIMVEAMTQGGFKPHGRVFVPADALNNEPVLYSYLKNYLEGIEILQAGKRYTVGQVSFTTPVRHIHPVETYGMVFHWADHRFSYISDTQYFDGLLQHYGGELVILNVVFTRPLPVDHLALPDAGRIISRLRPRVAILTHFGPSMWRSNPFEAAERLTRETGITVIAARDGMIFDLSSLTAT